MEHTLRAIAAPDTTRIISKITGNPGYLNFKGALFYNGIMCSDKIHFANGGDLGPLYVTQKAFALRNFGKGYCFVEPVAVHFEQGITLVYELQPGDVLVRHDMTSGELLYGDLKSSHTGMKQWQGQRNFLELPWNVTSVPSATEVYNAYCDQDHFAELHRRIKQMLSELPTYIYRSTRHHWHKNLMHDGSYAALNHGIKLAMSHWLATGTILFADPSTIKKAIYDNFVRAGGFNGFGCAIKIGSVNSDGMVTDVTVDPISVDTDFDTTDFLYLPILDPAKGACGLTADTRGYYTLPTQHMPTELMSFDDRSYGCHYRLIALIKGIADEPEEYSGKGTGTPPEPNRYLLGNMWFEVEPRAIRKGAGKFMTAPQYERVGGFETLPIGADARGKVGFYIYSAALKLLYRDNRW